MIRLSTILPWLVLCSVAFGQQMPVGTTARGMLVMSQDVKKELKITKDQDKKILAAMQDFGKAAQNGQFGADFSMSNPMGGLDPALETILNEVQKQRLEELFVQANGGFALTDAKVAAALALTDSQKEQVKTLDEEATDELMNMMRNARSNGALKAVKAKRKDLGEKVKALLTAEQATKFAAMQGKTFKFRG